MREVLREPLGWMSLFADLLALIAMATTRNVPGFWWAPPMKLIVSASDGF